MRGPIPGINPVYNTRGGQYTADLYSGNVVSGGTAAIAAPGAVVVGSDILVFSGGGRLNTVIPTAAISGVAFTVYDAHAVASGGPFVLSGHRKLFVMPANTIGQTGLLGGGPVPFLLDVPFYSGLCVNTRSGMTPATLAYTPEPT